MSEFLQDSIMLAAYAAMGAFYLTVLVLFVLGRPLSRNKSRHGRVVELVLGMCESFVVLDYAGRMAVGIAGLAGTEPLWAERLLMYADNLTFVVVCLMGYTIITKRYPRRWMAALAIGPAVLLAAADLLLGGQSGWMPSVASGYCVVLVMVMMIHYVMLIRRYADTMQSLYSNTEGRTLNWYLWMQIPLVVNMLMFFLLGSQHLLLHLLYLAVEAVCSGLILCFILRLRFSPEEEAAEEGEEMPEAYELKEAPEALERIAARLEELRPSGYYLDSELSLQQLSQLVGTNRTYLSYYFNHVEHLTFYAFVNRLRLEHACQLLHEPGQKPGQVWMDCGFGNEATFRKLFINTYGCTPSQYYREHTAR